MSHKINKCQSNLAFLTYETLLRYILSISQNRVILLRYLTKEISFNRKYLECNGIIIVLLYNNFIFRSVYEMSYFHISYHVALNETILRY